MKKKEAGINEIELLVEKYSIYGKDARVIMDLIKNYSFTSMSLQLALYHLSQNKLIKKDPAYMELRLNILEEIITMNNPIIKNLKNTKRHE